MDGWMDGWMDPHQPANGFLQSEDRSIHTRQELQHEENKMALNSTIRNTTENK